MCTKMTAKNKRPLSTGNSARAPKPVFQEQGGLRRSPRPSGSSRTLWGSQHLLGITSCRRPGQALAGKVSCDGQNNPRPDLPLSRGGHSSTQEADVSPAPGVSKDGPASAARWPCGLQRKQTSSAVRACPGQRLGLSVTPSPGGYRKMREILAKSL